MDDKEEAENIIKFFTEIQTCPDKRMAFIKGVLYGLGFCNVDTKRQPNWRIIEKLVEKGNDNIGWLNIEKEVLDINRKVYEKQVDVWLSLEDKKR